MFGANKTKYWFEQMLRQVQILSNINLIKCRIRYKLIKCRAGDPALKPLAGDKIFIAWRHIFIAWRHICNLNIADADVLLLAGDTIVIICNLHIVTLAKYVQESPIWINRTFIILVSINVPISVCHEYLLCRLAKLRRKTDDTSHYYIIMAEVSNRIIILFASSWDDSKPLRKGVSYRTNKWEAHQLGSKI